MARSHRCQERSRKAFSASRSAALLLTALALAWTLERGIVAEKKAEAAPEEKAPETLKDKITLKEGQPLEGDLLDITEKKVVISVSGVKKTFPRDQVTAITRAQPERLLAFFEKNFEKSLASKQKEDWTKLAEFCSLQKLLPERRKVLRELLRLEPDNAEARIELGHALFEGEWLDEEKVEQKVKEGYAVVEGKLMKSSSTVVKAPEPAKKSYKMLERKTLTAREHQRMEKDREDRLKSAEKFLAEKEKEYLGVPWEKRHKIRTAHFEINCNSTEKVARAYGALMELIRAKLAEMFPSKIRRNLRAAISIYSSQDEFIQKDRTARWFGRGLGGYYNPVTQSVTAYHGTFGFTGTTFGVLCHEGTHYFQGLVLNDFENIPIWLIEGLAVYFGDGSSFDPKTAKIEVGKIPRDRLADIQERMMVHRQAPIEKLITMTRANFSGTQYADAWALIYFLVQSGEKGKKLLTEYWALGLERNLTKKDFITLAEKYFGDVASLERQYVDYILKLEMPPAGKVIGDYFVSDVFQFDFKTPGEEWQFFEDKEDKKTLIGLAYPGTSAEIRVSYRNNFFNAKSEAYLDDYLRMAKPLYKDLNYEPAKISGLKGYKLRYLDERGENVELSDLGALDKLKAARGLSDEREKKLPARSGAREITNFLLIQDDGVISIEGSAKPSEVKQFEDVFDKVNEQFTLTFTRRW